MNHDRKKNTRPLIASVADERPLDRRRLIRVGLLGLLALNVVGCGSGGGGGNGDEGPPVEPIRFTKTVVMPVSGGDWDGLFVASAGTRRYEALVRARDTRGAGPLKSIAFRFGEPSSGNSCPNATIKLTHRPVSATLSTTFANNVSPGSGAPVTVFGPATLTIPSGASGDFFTIPLSGEFNYNGVENLIVDIETDACTANTSLNAQAASPAYTALIWNMSDRTAATGATWNSLADMKFNFSGGGNYVQSPGSLGSNVYPFESYGSGAKTQVLYLRDEIDGAGPITGIAFPVAAVTTAQTHTVTVKLGHSTLGALTDTFANNFNSGTPVTMANALTFAIPAGVPVDGYIWVPLPDGAFVYNGTDNLIVEISASSASAATSIRTHQDGVSQRRLVATPSATTGSLDSIVNDIQFRFAGGTLDVLTPSAMTLGALDSFPFMDTNGKRQYLYRAAELGSPGTITKFACRIAPSAGDVAETGFAYTVKLGHATAATLDATFANNSTSAVTVFSGNFDLPAVAAGDWVEIPFTTPFAYNGRDNLVLEISGTGGAAGGFACASDNTAGSATLYNARRLFGATSTETVGTPGNSMIDTRFTLN